MRPCQAPSSLQRLHIYATINRWRWGRVEIGETLRLKSNLQITELAFYPIFMRKMCYYICKTVSKHNNQHNSEYNNVIESYYNANHPLIVCIAAVMISFVHHGCISSKKLVLDEWDGSAVLQKNYLKVTSQYFLENYIIFFNNT